MLVNQILSMKASGEIFTVAPTATVAEAAKLLSDKREIDSLHGRIALGFLISKPVQTICR